MTQHLSIRHPVHPVSSCLLAGHQPDDSERAHWNGPHGDRAKKQVNQKTSWVQSWYPYWTWQVSSLIIIIESTYRRKFWQFRHQTSDNMDRWKSRCGKSQEGKPRSEKSTEEKEWEERRKKMQAREKGRQFAILCVFSMICASGCSKSRLAKAVGAKPSGQIGYEKWHAVVARSTVPSQKCKL